MKNHTLNPEAPSYSQLHYIVGEIFKESGIQVSYNELPEGTELTAYRAEDFASMFKILNNMELVGTTRIEAPGKPSATAYFVRSKKGGKAYLEGLVGLAMAETGKIFLDMEHFWRSAQSWMDAARRSPDPSTAMYGGEAILRKYVQEVAYHEYVHVLTTPYIRSAAFRGKLPLLIGAKSGDRYMIASEVAGYLGHLYATEDPRAVMETIMSEPDIKTYCGLYRASTYSIIQEKLIWEYGSIDAFNRLDQEARRAGIREIFRKIFAMELPDVDCVKVPDRILDEHASPIMPEPLGFPKEPIPDRKNLDELPPDERALKPAPGHPAMR